MRKFRWITTLLFASSAFVHDNHTEYSDKALLMMQRSPLPLLKDRYQLVKPLDSGGMGTVYVAEDRRLGNKLVAVKANLHSSSDQQEQFNQEALLLADLEHFALPRVTDNFTEPDGRQYLVMDYIDGQNLLQLLRSRQHPFDEAVVLGWLPPILAALAYLHQRPKPVIHRDIKPSNLKLRRDSKIFLVDFGLAKVSEDDLTMAGARGAVTVGYAPPEQYSGGTDARSDIYALGATLYHLLTGRKPPDARMLVDKTTRLAAPRTINSNISRKLERVILKAMELEPKNRYQTVGELSAALPGAPPKRKGNMVDFLLIALVVLLLIALLFITLSTPPTWLTSLINRASSVPTATTTPIVTAMVTATSTPTAPAAVATVAPRCPAGMVFIDARASAFCIDQTEVTNAAYQACVEAAICDPPPPSAAVISPTLTYTLYATDPTYADYPVLNITVAQAIHYCEQYVGVFQKQPHVRLPTFDEWWVAYRQSNTTPVDITAPLSVTASPLKSEDNPLFGMAGNVQEWVVATATPWVAVALGENFAESDFPQEEDILSNFRRVLRNEANASSYIEVGFRCAADPNAAN